MPATHQSHAIASLTDRNRSLSPTIPASQAAMSWRQCQTVQIWAAAITGT